MDSVTQLLRMLYAAGRPSPVRLHTAYAREVTDLALAARSVEDLIEHIDVLASDARFFAEELAAAPPVPAMSVAEAMESSLDVVSLDRVLGLAATQRCVAGWDALKTVADVVSRLAKVSKPVAPPPPVDPEVATLQARITDVVSMIDLAYDPTIPEVLRQFIVGFLRWIVTSRVIARAEERGARLAPWLAWELANQYAASLIQFGALARSIWEGNTEPLTIAWNTLRADHQRSVDERAVLDSAAERWIAAARVAGDDTFSPFGDADDGAVR